MNNDLNELMDTIGYHFKDISLLKNALTHSSYANEKKTLKIKDNERLEFLGDAVLELSSSDYIFKHFKMNEGRMTRLRASIVCEPTLALCAREFGFQEFIKLGKGEELTGGRKRDSIVSDALEALIGAIYLDSDFANAKEFIEKFILNDLEHKQLFFDSKTILQEVVQGLGKEVTYTSLREEGPEHDKTFVVEVEVPDLIKIEGIGHNKKNAQANAAYKALVELKNNGIEIKDSLK